MRCSLFIVACLLLFAGVLSAQVSEVDSVWIDSIGSESGQSVVLGVYIKNSDYNKGIQVPLSYTYPDLIIDSVSFVGSRVENKFLKIIQFDPAQALINIGAVNLSGDSLDSGRGLFASIHITIPPEFPTQVIVFDTVFIPPESHLLFVSASNYSYTPQFTPGKLDNTGDLTDADDETSNILPASFELRQNHPNPFNPTTTISFTLPKQGRLRLEVFNITGQKVRTIADGNQPAGTYSVIFDGCDEKGNQLASGIYFYRITTENDTETKKMIMLK